MVTLAIAIVVTGAAYMEVPIVDSYDRPTAQEMFELSSAIGLDIPPDVEQFLAQFNGGWLHEDVVSNEEMQAHGRITFLSVGQRGTTGTRIIDCIQYVPGSMIPIAYSSISNSFFCCLASGHECSVFLVPPAPGRVVKIASSLNTWLDLFHLRSCDCPADANIFDLCRDSCLDRLKSLVESPWDALRTSSGETLLHLAVSNGQPGVVRELLRVNPASASLTTRKGETALHCSAMSHSLDSCRQLIKAGCSLDIQDADGRTALMIAVRRGSVKVGRMLIDAGCQLDLKDATGKTAADYCVGIVARRELLPAILNAAKDRPVKKL